MMRASMRHALFALALAGLGSLTTAQTARADEPPAPGERTVFYGYQNMIASYTGLAIFSTGGLSLSGGSLFGAAIFLTASPIIHGIHGDDGRRIVVSLGLDLAFPFFGGLIASNSGGDSAGCRSVNGGCLYDSLDRTGKGVMIGMAIAPLLDGLLLGWKTVQVPVALTPTMSIARKDEPRSATMIGVRGAF